MVVVTFVVDGEVVCTAVDQKPKTGRPLKRLRNVGENPVVTMLAGHYSEDWERCGGFAPTGGRRS